MSATTAAALKAFVEGLGLGLSAFRDEPPEGWTTWPYVTVTEDVALVPGGLEDGGALLAGLAGTQAPANRPDGSYQVGTETAQLDLWQRWRLAKLSDPVQENYSLPDQLLSALHGARLPTAPHLVYAVKVLDRQRLLDRPNLVVQHAFTLTIERQI